jgi:hypothetical protein
LRALQAIILLTRITPLVICLALGWWAFAVAEDVSTTRPTSPTLTDLEGIPRQPLCPAKDRAAVLIFIRTDCPVSNTYAPEINRLVKEYRPKKIGFYVIYTIKDLSESDALRHVKLYGYSCPALIDLRHELVDAVGATVTPEAAVVGGDGKLLYRGRIDDLFVGLGRQRYEATTHELRDALDALLAGRQPDLKFTRAVGCAITKD